MVAQIQYFAAMFKMFSFLPVSQRILPLGGNWRIMAEQGGEISLCIEYLKIERNIGLLFISILELVQFPNLPKQD